MTYVVTVHRNNSSYYTLKTIYLEKSILIEIYLPCWIIFYVGNQQRKNMFKPRVNVMFIFQV